MAVIDASCELFLVLIVAIELLMDVIDVSLFS